MELALGTNIASNSESFCSLMLFSNSKSSSSSLGSFFGIGLVGSGQEGSGIEGIGVLGIGLVGSGLEGRGKDGNLHLFSGYLVSSSIS